MTGATNEKVLPLSLRTSDSKEQQLATELLGDTEPGVPFVINMLGAKPETPLYAEHFERASSRLSQLILGRGNPIFKSCKPLIGACVCAPHGAVSKGRKHRRGVGSTSSSAFSAKRKTI